MTKIFVSYRQADNADFVYRIRDWLINRYGADNVFIDFDGLPPFVVFEDVIRERIAESDAVLVIIGARWLELLNQKAASADDDYVKIEVEAAIARESEGLIIAPVLIKGASMPTAADLPEGMRRLCKINAARLTDGGKAFEGEIKALMEAIDAVRARKKPSTMPPTVHTSKSGDNRIVDEYLSRGNECYGLADYDGARFAI
ncbi:MAG: toll/interleukin-1 receptor domain-containing protein [Anaerolineae bacterium]